MSRKEPPQPKVSASAPVRVNSPVMNRGRHALFLTPRELRPLEFSRCAEFEVIDSEVVAGTLDAFTVREIVVRQLRLNDQLIAIQNVSSDGLTARTKRGALDSHVPPLPFTCSFLATA